MTQRRPLRVVFFGTPNFAVPTLRSLIEDDRYDVQLVVTQPDRPAGRGQRLMSTPVKQAAVERGLPIFQPATLRFDADREKLKAADADLFVVAAFGLIFGRKTLDIPRYGCVNVHASILPRYRGASPIAAAIASGDEETGVSLMQMAVGLDTGPVVATSTIAISPDDTTETLTLKLADLAAQLAIFTLAEYAAGEIVPRPQDAARASVVRPLTKADGWLDWTLPATRLERWVRAMWPWPRAWTTLAGQTLQIHRASVADLTTSEHPGQVVELNGALGVQTGEGVLQLDVVQLSGGRPLPGSVIASGRIIRSGAVLGESGAPEHQAAFISDLPVPSG